MLPGWQANEAAMPESWLDTGMGQGMSSPFDTRRSDGSSTRTVLNSAAADPGGGGGGGGSGNVTKADTQRMDQSANALVDLRGDTENVDNAAVDDTRSSVMGLNKHTAPGPPEEEAWETARALTVLDDRWGNQVQNLKSMLQDISDKLHATTGHYTRREQEEQAQMDSMNSAFG